MNPLNTLISKYLDGSLTAEEGATLNEWLKTTPGELGKFTELLMLDQEIRQTVQARAERHAGAAFVEQDSRVETSPTQPQTLWRQWRPLTAAASIGVLLGLLFSPATWALVTERRIWVEGFEGSATTTLAGIPSKSGSWSGDEAHVVGPQNNITPRQGQKMLRFESASYPGENAPRSSWSDIYRLVEVSELGGAIGEQTTVRLSACFAAAPFPDGEEYACNVGLYALETDPAAGSAPLALVSIRDSSIATGSRHMPLNRTGKWQVLSQELIVPPQARFLLIHLAMVEKLPKRTSGTACFRAHYLDDVRLDVLKTGSH